MEYNTEQRMECNIEAHAYGNLIHDRGVGRTLVMGEIVCPHSCVEALYLHMAVFGDRAYIKK
jgi:hypothetical protein